MDVKKSFFLDLLRDKRMSLRTLAKRMDILPSQLSLTFSGVRRMQIAEAVKIAQVLGAPINEVMVNAGIEEARTDRRRCKVVGFLNGDCEVDAPADGVIDKTLMPEGLSSECEAIQARTVGTPMAWADGWVFFSTEKQDPDDLEGRFVRAKIKDGPEVLATIRRGYEPGTFNLSGPRNLVSQRIDWAKAIVLTRH